MKIVAPTLIAITCALVLAGCAGERLHSDGLSLIRQGKPEEGLRQLEEAVAAEPGNVRFRTDLLSYRGEQIDRILAHADSDKAAGKWQEASEQYARILRIEPANRRAASGLDAVDRARRNTALVEQAREAIKAKDNEKAQNILRLVVSDEPGRQDALELQRQIDEAAVIRQLASPQLKAALRKPVNLQFRDANIRMVFDALSRSTGVDFVVDKDVRQDLRTSVVLRQAVAEEALNMLLQTNNLEKKVLGPSSILIFANTPDKLKEFQDLVVKGFYLSNADVKQTQALIKSVLKTKDTFIDEKLNLLVMRDTPDAIRLAEKLIAMHDLAEPEVMLDVEVLEVKRSRLTELGVQWPSQLVVTPIMSKVPVVDDLRGLNGSRLGITTPSATLNVRSTLGDANILANPRIRARNREKAKVMIGDKVPVTTNTATATGLVSESVQYLDVGIKLEAEPTIYLQGDVAIRIGLEVSTLVREIRTPGGSLAYQIGSRSAGTVLRLKDGETQVLAGLISDEDRRDASRVPALGDLPILGRLFGSQKDDREKTEIVLSITPHLVRNIERPSAAAGEFWSGTEATLRTRAPGFDTAGDAPATARADAAAPAGNSTQAIPAGVSFSWQGPAKVKQGETFKLALRMNATGGIRSVPLQFGFDPAGVEVVDIAEGAYFKKDDTQTSFSTNVSVQDGRAMASVVRSGTDGTRGDDAVVILTLKALKQQPGEFKLLSTAPMGVGDKTVPPTMPAPFTLQVE